MFTREYNSFKVGNRDNITVSFLDTEEDKYALQNFLFSETHNFREEIVAALDAVLSGRRDTIDFSGNMSACEGNAQEVEVYFNYMEEELGPSVFMPTIKLKELVDEWIEMEDKFRRGELDGKLPLVIEDEDSPFI